MTSQPEILAPEALHHVTFTVNGAAYEIDVPARRLLSDALRQDVGLTGTHVGCEHGVCGACTILVDGRPMRACLLLAVSVEGASLTTVEGLTESGDRLGPVQQAFKECHGLQCGFCTPGFLTTITAGLRENPDPTEDEAREMIAGNLCRCTGYQNIVKSVLRAAEIAGSRQARPAEGPLVEPVETTPETGGDA
ncbi:MULTISPECIES: (2Fe-2S)-binding protein [Mumia]|uniref:(2Fe-2S)-binding protein n=1 Tax=Mumia TaxID=1546255 RepID=UPI0014221E04|nr:(2Fe-2S)-binding protein [Mumia sp. ZJ430]